MSKSQSLADAMIVTVRQPLLVLNAELQVKRANPAFYDLFKVTPEQTSDRLIYDLGNGQWNIPALRHLLEAVLGGEERVADPCARPDIIISPGSARSLTSTLNGMSVTGSRSYFNSVRPKTSRNAQRRSRSGTPSSEKRMKHGARSCIPGGIAGVGGGDWVDSDIADTSASADPFEIFGFGGKLAC